MAHMKYLLRFVTTGARKRFNLKNAIVIRTDTIYSYIVYTIMSALYNIVFNRVYKLHSPIGFTRMLDVCNDTFFLSRGI